MLNKTGHSKLAYVGHSQGTTQMFYGLSEDESWFANRVSLYVALAPVTKLSHTEAGFIKWAAQYYSVLDDATSIYNMYSIGGTGEQTSSFCGDPVIAEFCR